MKATTWNSSDRKGFRLMTRPCAVICYPVEERHLRWMADAMPQAHWINAGQEGIAEAIHQADYFIGHAKVPVDWDRVVAQGHLRWIQSSAAGLDHCLVPSVIDSPITVCSASGLFADQVAEQTMALLLGLLRGLPTFFRQTLQRSYAPPMTFMANASASSAWVATVADWWKCCNPTESPFERSTTTRN
jgi:phosphoglycerate dehydrogenase-like enzyme